MTKGKSLRGRHFIITGIASIVLTITIITILICRSLWRRRWIGAKASLSTCYMTDMGVHLTQFISESVKASIHALKLHHDGLQGHITSRRRRRRGGRNSRSCRTDRLHTWLLWSKLSLASSNRTGIDGTHSGVIRRIRMEKWRRIRVIVEGKMSLSQVAVF